MNTLLEHRTKFDTDQLLRPQPLEPAEAIVLFKAAKTAGSILDDERYEQLIPTAQTIMTNALAAARPASSMERDGEHIPRTLVAIDDIYGSRTDSDEHTGMLPIQEDEYLDELTPQELRGAAAEGARRASRNILTLQEKARRYDRETQKAAEGLRSVPEDQLPDAALALADYAITAQHDFALAEVLDVLGRHQELSAFVDPESLPEQRDAHQRLAK